MQRLSPNLAWYRNKREAHYLWVNTLNISSGGEEAVSKW